MQLICTVLECPYCTCVSAHPSDYVFTLSSEAKAVELRHGNLRPCLTFGALPLFE
jgi:hypothetical protein